MNWIKTNLPFNFLFAAIAFITVMYSLEACSKKSTSSKTTTSEPAKQEAAPVAAPIEEKDGMQIKRDAAGNYVIQLVIVNLEPVKLMKPVKEGYVVWMISESNVTTNIGTIEGANNWTTRKDKSRFEAASIIKPTKVFITAETDLQAQKPGTQVVWSTGTFK